MNVNVAGIRRKVKNAACNYSDAEVKVREATSNDPWGPSSTLMSEIAELTYNMVAFSEIMLMIWKRLNDDGKKWRHVYKALVLLEYLIKTGSEKVAQQCKENIYAIQTLKDFQYIEENKDQGLNVREKAKSLVSLLKDDERLKNERGRALKARERFAQSVSAISNTTTFPPPGDHGNAFGSTSPRGGTELETARPQTAGEEELQLQLALAMSREEAEQEDIKRRSDDVRLQMALTQSEDDFRKYKGDTDKQNSGINDLLNLSLSSPSPQGAVGGAAIDPWGMPEKHQQPDPWSGENVARPLEPASATGTTDPWTQPKTAAAAVGLLEQSQQPKHAGGNDVWGMPATATSNDPWVTPATPANGELDEFAALSSRDRNNHTNGTTLSPTPFQQAGTNTLMGPPLTSASSKKSPETFLGENSALVNLDNLISAKPRPASPANNPFSMTQAAQQNPFHAQQAPRPTINEIRTQQQQPFVQPPAPTASTDPWSPHNQQRVNNPFLA